MGRLHRMVQSGLGPWSNNRPGYPDLMSGSNRAVPDSTFLSHLHEDREDDFLPMDNDPTDVRGVANNEDEWEDLIEKDENNPIVSAVHDVLSSR